MQSDGARAEANQLIAYWSQENEQWDHAELDFVHTEASNDRKLHQESLKYAELRVLALRKNQLNVEQF